MSEQEIPLDSDTFDVVLMGTGLVESILSGAIARVGKKVLHLDRNEFYGGPYASFSLQSFNSFMESAQQPQQPSISEDENVQLDGKQVRAVRTCGSAAPSSTSIRPGVEFRTASETILSDVKSSRRYNIDITPRALWSLNPTIEVLVRAGVNRYLEFKCLDHTFAYVDNRIQQVPCSKGDIFKSKTISVLEKRQLMKLITAITKPEESDKAEIEVAAQTPFIDYLASRGLSQNLQTFILYSIAMIGPDQRAPAEASKVTTAQGVEYMMRFLRSLGRYGNTPLIYPLFGMSDIPQAFCRFSAVYGTTFVLGHAANRILVNPENNKVEGIICGTKTMIKAPLVVSSLDHIPSFISESASETQPFVARLVCAIDKSLDSEGGDNLLFATIPPHAAPEFDNPDTIYILQLDPSTNCCPVGKFLVHMWTSGSTNSSANLRALASKFICMTTSDEESTLPKMDWMSVFEQRIRQPVAELPQGLFAVPDPEQSIDPDACFNQAKQIFKKLFPEEEFIPEVPHPDDVKWGEEEESATTPASASEAATDSTVEAKSAEDKPTSEDIPTPDSF